MPEWMEYEITSKFNDPDDVGGRRSGPHKGVDLATPLNTAIQPTDRGKVVQAGYDPKLGYFVKVQHSWGVTTYLHGSRVLVKKGDDVGPSTVLMYSGSSGAATGPHLEFRVQTPEGAYVDPEPLIIRSRQRAGVSRRGLLDDPDDFPVEEEGDEDEGGGIDWGDFPTAGSTGESRLDQILKAGGLFKTLRKLGPAAIGQIPQSTIRQRMGGAPGIYSNELEDYETSPRGKVPSSGLWTQGRDTGGRSLQDLLSGFGGFGNVGDVEAEYQLPFFEPSMGGDPRASRNVLRAAGINPDIGNPYASFLEKKIQKQAPQALATRWMRGEPTNQRQMAQDLAEMLQQGRGTVSSREDLLSGLGRLETNEGLNEPQQSLVELLISDPEFGYQLISGSLNLPGKLEQASRRAYAKSQERWMNQAPELENTGVLNFIKKYLE